jgi:hypothetical protein
MPRRDPGRAGAFLYPNEHPNGWHCRTKGKTGRRATGLTGAATTDHHFEQANLAALLK